MRRHQPVGGLRVLMLLPTLGEHVLLVGLEHRELADLLEVAGEAASAGDDRRKCFRCHLNLSLRFDLSKRLLLLCSPSGAIHPARYTLGIKLGDMEASI